MIQAIKHGSKRISAKCRSMSLPYNSKEENLGLYIMSNVHGP